MSHIVGLFEHSLEIAQRVDRDWLVDVCHRSEATRACANVFAYIAVKVVTCNSLFLPVSLSVSVSHCRSLRLMTLRKPCPSGATRAVGP